MKNLALFLLVSIPLWAQGGPSYPYSVTNNWTLSTAPLTDISGQNIYRAAYLGAESCGTFVKLNSSLLANNVTTYIDPTVTNGTPYCYEVTAVDINSNETLPSNVTYPGVPPAPQTGLTVVTTSGKPVLNWTGSSTSGVTGQRAYCGPQNGTMTQKWTATAGTWGGPNVRTVTLGNLAHGARQCAVSAYSDGESALSNIVNFTF
jgi:hypothetical protein